LVCVDLRPGDECFSIRDCIDSYISSMIFREYQNLKFRWISSLKLVLNVVGIWYKIERIKSIRIIDELDKGADHICCYPRTCVVICRLLIYWARDRWVSLLLLAASGWMLTILTAKTEAKMRKSTVADFIAINLLKLIHTLKRFTIDCSYHPCQISTYFSLSFRQYLSLHKYSILLINISTKSTLKSWRSTADNIPPLPIQLLKISCNLIHKTLALLLDFIFADDALYLSLQTPRPWSYYMKSINICIL